MSSGRRRSRLQRSGAREGHVWMGSMEYTRNTLGIHLEYTWNTHENTLAKYTQICNGIHCIWEYIKYMYSVLYFAIFLKSVFFYSCILLQPGQHWWEYGPKRNTPTRRCIPLYSVVFRCIPGIQRNTLRIQQNTTFV